MRCQSVGVKYIFSVMEREEYIDERTFEDSAAACSAAFMRAMMTGLS